MMNTGLKNPREVFMQALQFFQQGQLGRCEQLCRELLQLNPREVNSLRLYGQLAHRQGDLEEAHKAFDAVISLAPDYAHAYGDRARVHWAEGRQAEAIADIRQALALDSSLHPLRQVLQGWLEQTGQQAEAEQQQQHNRQRQVFREAVTEAFRLFAEDELEEARQRAKHLLEEDPDNVMVKLLLVDIALKNFNANRAEQLCRQLVQRVPENWQIWNRLSRALMMQERTEEAAEALAFSHEASRDNPDTVMLEADIAIKDGDYARGIHLYEQVLEDEPQRNAARAQLGLALKTVGKQQQSIEILRECIARDECQAEAWWALSDMKTFRFDDHELSHAQQVLAERTLDPQSRVFMGYAIGKGLEHRKAYREAFAAYKGANDLKKTLVSYDAAENSRFTDALIAAFDEELFSRWQELRCSEERPIFIVSLPRSGSTLQEQILASHSRVEGTDELPYLTRISRRLHRGAEPMAKQAFPLGIREVNEQALRAMAAEYVDKARFHRHTDKPYFIDKLPNNFAYVGLIALLFPRAKIINARRHPLDSCLGCYKQHWAMGQHFTYDLEDLGHYYRDYHRLMQHWHKVLPGRVLDVHYESVVEDLESNVRRVLEFCELDFEENCLEFYKTQRAVKTSSSEQVRKPIYRSALAYWQNFEQELQPLMGLLDDVLQDYC